MSLTATLPLLADSPLTPRDARWKLVALGGLALTLACLRTLPASATGLACAALLVWWAKVPWSWLKERLQLLVPLLSLLLLLPLLIDKGGPCWTLGPVRCSLDGALVALRVASITLAVLLTMLTLFATTPMDELLAALRALHVPSLLVQLLALTYRYLFLLLEELHRLRIALRLRGYRHRTSRHSYHTVAQVSGALLVRSAERAERIGHALRCRGFTGEYHTLHEFQTHWRDVLYFVLIMALGLLLLSGDLAWKGPA